MDVCAGGVGYYLFGYAFAYGDPQSCDDSGVCVSTGNPFIGSKMFALHDLSEDSYHIYYFQFVVRVQFTACCCKTAFASARAAALLFNQQTLHKNSL